VRALRHELHVPAITAIASSRLRAKHVPNLGEEGNRRLRIPHTEVDKV
jgi:hypothetical protein